MSSSKVRSAALFAAAATIVAFATPASAFDFKKPAEKRVYCQVYARQALNDVRTSQTRSCGFTGISWSSDFTEQFNWCMGQSDVSATTEENLARSTAVENCSGEQTDFPPVVPAAPAQTASNFPPVEADAPAEASSTFPPVVDSAPAPEAVEEPAAQTASFPQVADAPARVRTSKASFPPVADASEPDVAEPDVGDVASTSDADVGGDRGQEIVQRLVEFGQEHEDEIREAAEKFKEKIKNKLSEIKERHDQDNNQAADTLKEKIKQKLSDFRSRHGDHNDQAASGLKEKIKQKLSGLKERHGSHHAQEEHSLKTKVKHALKDGLMRRLAGR